MASDMVYECLAESNEPMVMIFQHLQWLHNKFSTEKSFKWSHIEVLINKSINRTQEETCRSISGANSVVDFNLPWSVLWNWFVTLTSDDFRKSFYILKENFSLYHARKYFCDFAQSGHESNYYRLMRLLKLSRHPLNIKDSYTNSFLW